MTITFNHVTPPSQNVEAEVNIQFPRSLEGDRDGQYLLSRQLRRLQVGVAQNQREYLYGSRLSTAEGGKPGRL